MTLEELNRLEAHAAADALQRCCGSTQWVSQMLASRPFSAREDLFRKSEDIWWRLAESDWKEAFAHHPRIGDVEGLRLKFASTASWAEGEQAGIQSASEDVLGKLATANRIYEERFGYIFIVCATGKSAEQMLELLNARLRNRPDVELKIAAEEQAKITRIRLEKLLTSPSS